LIKSVNGIGNIIGLTLLYEIHDIHRFDTIQGFMSYCRLVKCLKTSDGKPKGVGGSKRGNHHLKWAFSEAAVLFLRGNPEGQRLHSRARHSPVTDPTGFTSSRSGQRFE
jgi:transposase